MPFTLHQSNDLEALAEKLAGVLDAGCRNANDPFRREIIVADRQFFRWLQIQIAKRNGLCPATEFLRPGKFIYDHVFSAIENPLPETDPETSDEPPFNPDSVRWRIFALLESGLEKRPEFVRVRNFVNGDALKRFQLSSRLASLFDKYMTERPDVMCDWEKMWDKSPDLSREENKFDTLWQSLLWRELIAQTPRRTLHFSGLFAKFKAESRKPGFAGKFATLREAGRVSVLTPTPLPPAHLEIFRVLAATGVCDIHFLTLNPCREFWADAKKSDMPPDTNPLLASLGKLGSYYLGQFIEPFAPDFEEECFTEYGDSTLLHAIQNSILDNKPPPNSQISTLNSQLSVHSCHSPQREAEVLRDRLLALLTADPTLQPSDIRVAVTDIDAYAPHIQAVFSTSEPRIPFTISGCAAKNDIPEFGAFLNLISAATGRFKASEILALLNHEPISKRFAFSDDDRLSLPPLLKRAGVAWGADAAFRESQGAARDYANTWRFALDRLILGAAMGEPPDITDTLTLDDGASRVAPLADTHTSAPLIGRAADFLTAVERFATRVSAEARSCAEWIDEMYGTADDFFARDSESAPGLAALRTVFAELRRDITHAGCDGGGRFPRVPFAVIAAVLGERLGEQRPARGADIGFVRFAPLNATAAIPARVVCLMGMNEGVFPRNPPQLSFDITDKRNGRQLRTDRPVPEQDRYAFLLALMAARENFLITYTGQDINDNPPTPPAAPVAELLEFCGAIRPDCEFSITHPLHPFSPRYFDNASPHLVSFDRVNYDIARKLANTGSPEYDDAMLTAVANAEWVLNAEPIARIAAKTFPYDKNAGKKAERKTGNGTPEGKKARKSAQRKTDRNLVGEVGLLFAKIGGKIERENFGTVILTKNGATESIAHGFTTQAKADAFATVPDVIKHGKIISREINWKGRGYD
ncbi:MAG: exodeoxyribonuclease V subunit gamma, partial [Kiritimatiellaeota bacterium]|nr:exodeoxyribonuclease V subunit gamma [Kiritimatiellota bacterium]